jgi:hypothetical protein
MPAIMKQEAFEPTWVLFIASEDEHLLRRVVQLENGRVSHYHVEDVVSVAGDAHVKLVPGWRVVRIESEIPFQLSEGPRSVGGGQFDTFRGVTEHFHYTSVTQRQELDARSHGEFEPSIETRAVLIPIGKSPMWWALAQDQRQAHFQTTNNSEGHTAIGLRYADRVFRKLYHSRYLTHPAPYDFLTYFEFHRSYEDDFRMLLKDLRNSTQNPEWAYVDLEFEIWMTKVG